MKLNIPIKLKFHDVIYTTEVFKKIYDRRIKPEIYHLHKDRETHRGDIKKTTLDAVRLINQFEEMFHREMTFEEQTIIKLAYKMGSTINCP